MHCSSIKTSQPIPQSSNHFYFELTVVESGKDGAIGIGFTPSSSGSDSMPGWDKNSVGYHGDVGSICYESCYPIATTETFETGDVVGCEFTRSVVENVQLAEYRFTKNGRAIGPLTVKEYTTELYPTIGFNTPGAIVRPNLGETDFTYHIKGKYYVLLHISGRVWRMIESL